MLSFTEFKRQYAKKSQEAVSKAYSEHDCYYVYMKPSGYMIISRKALDIDCYLGHVDYYKPFMNLDSDYEAYGKYVAMIGETE